MQMSHAYLRIVFIRKTHICSYWCALSKKNIEISILRKSLPVLTTQGNPPLATALSIAAPPVASAVAMTHFVVATGGEKFHVVYKILQKS